MLTNADFWRGLQNNAIFVVVVVPAQTAMALGLARRHALARLRFRGRASMVTLVIALIIVPFEALAVPLLYLSAQLGWLDTYPVQILPFIANPLFVYLFYTFFLNVPKALEEAARVDGAGPVRTFVSIVAPSPNPPTRRWRSSASCSRGASSSGRLW